MTTKKQREAAGRLVELAAEAERLLLDIGPVRDAPYYVACHAARTLAERAEELRIGTLTAAEYAAELGGDA